MDYKNNILPNSLHKMANHLVILNIFKQILLTNIDNNNNCHNVRGKII